MAMINLDTIGRLFGKKLIILGTVTAIEWHRIFQICGKISGLRVVSVPALLDSSDNISFVAKGIPAVQVFSGAHIDYHTPGDIPNKLDYTGLTIITKVVRIALFYLANRNIRLSKLRESNISGLLVHHRHHHRGKSRVRFGIIPDFSYTGKGVRFIKVIPGFPAA